MKHFTLTLLILLLQWCSLHKISCNVNNDGELHDAPLSDGAVDLLKVTAVNLTHIHNSTEHTALNEKKLQRDQRTLYRKSGGHLRSDISATTEPHSSTDSTTPTSSTTESSKSEIVYSNVKNHKSYFRRKTKVLPSRVSSDSGRTRNRDVQEKSSSKKIINVTILNSSNSKESNDDENNLDYGLMAMSAAGEGNRNRTDEEDLSRTSAKDVKKDESKKTLSDQIAEGKYGLIEKELFSKVPKAPGIISYKTNSETPNDNEKTLGGLSKDEIWLAEDHLLVLKGGVTNDKKNNENEEDWVPIDNYEAPKRPVKIPLNPKVPPPFPIQLEDNGPLQFIGHNQFSLFNPFTNETGLFTNVEGHIKANVNSANGNHKKNPIAGLGAVKNLTKDQIHEVIPPPPWLFHNSYKDADLLKHFPFNLPLPDPILNKSEEFDEDDPSLFYPPPYSFVYKTNYTNLAPIGPLVPGIILPPPPDFFAPYNPEEDNKPIKTPLDAYKRIKEIQLKNRLSASTTVAPSTTTHIPPRTTSGYIRDFTRKTKAPATTPVPTTTVKTLYKTKTTTLRPLTVPTTPKEIVNFKTLHHHDTTTLRLHPVYVPTSVTTKLYTSTTTPAPQEPVKPYKQDYGTQAHPIYFEYFDARTANPLGQPFGPIGPEYETNTNVPPSGGSGHHHKKPKSFYPPQFISSTISPANVDAKYLFVSTQKPDVYGQYPVATDSPLPLSYNTAIPVQKPLILKPVGRFEDEISAIKQTLDYYRPGKKHTQKPSKVKAVYEFSFEASKHKNQDYTRPDVNYSHLGELINSNSYFPTSTEPAMKYYRTKQAATLPPKKNAQYTSETSAAPHMMYGQKLRQQNVNYYVRPIFKEVVTSPHQSQSQKIIVYPQHDTQQTDHGYRINSKNTKYHNQQQQQQQPQYYGPASEVASLLNDTLVNYKQPQRPINPYSEFIDVSRFPQNRPIQHSPLPPPPPPPPQHHHNPFAQSHSFNPHQIYPGPFQRPLQHYQQAPIDLKFGYPLIPQINPESVQITFYNRPMEKSSQDQF